jgi:hypothetical protein
MNVTKACQEDLMRLDEDVLQNSSIHICYIAAYTYMGLYVVVANEISVQILQGRC